ncbi:MAG: glycine cleavage system protein GcvH [Candidatus Marinimicrobia bacterium]|nr:glycine cleavage system protein GcvH [Candidatus Neomarinimicrobiota bacterium]
MNIPDNLKYSTDHEWVTIENNIVTLGITDFAQGELGDIIFIEFPEVGDSIEKGDSFGTVEAVKTVSDLFTPLSGEVVEINNTLEDNPEIVNADPYHKGWIIKLSITDESELNDLMDAKSYKEHIG